MILTTGYYSDKYKIMHFKGGYCKLLKLLILVSTPLIPINTKSTSIDYQVIDILMRLP